MTLLGKKKNIFYTLVNFFSAFIEFPNFFGPEIFEISSHRLCHFEKIVKFCHSPF